MDLAEVDHFVVPKLYDSSAIAINRVVSLVAEHHAEEVDKLDGSQLLGVHLAAFDADELVRLVLIDVDLGPFLQHVVDDVVVLGLQQK